MWKNIGWYVLAPIVYLIADHTSGAWHYAAYASLAGVVAVLCVAEFGTSGDSRRARRANEVVARARAKIENAVDEPARGSPSLTVTTGTYRGRRVSLLRASLPTVSVELPNWPAKLELRVAGTPKGKGTGDVEFDRVVELIGSEELWRPILTSALRKTLVALFRDYGASVIDGALNVGLAEKQFKEFERVWDVVTSLEVPRVTEPEAGVFDRLDDEADRHIRRAHYEWLLARGWSVPIVYRRASEDRDPEIAAWGAQHVTPDDGAAR